MSRACLDPRVRLRSDQGMTQVQSRLSGNPWKDYEPSRMYLFVRGRQLEGTFPGAPGTGIWPITSWRISRGWGVPPESTWPYNGDASAWPPSEPPGIDASARRYRGGRYQRVRTLQECRIVLGSMGFPVMVSLKITGTWGSAPGGRISFPSPSEAVVGCHTVLVEGYDDSKSEFKFANSWGADWGDHGSGYIGYDTLEATWVEGWVGDFPEEWSDNWPGNMRPIGSRGGVVERAWGIAEHGGGVFHCREFEDAQEERIGWAFAIEREGRVEVEELFIRPQFRRSGYGTKLIRSLNDLAGERGMSLKVWISFADIASENLGVIERLTHPLGLSLRSSGVRWAALVASAESEVPTAGQRECLPPGLRPRVPSRRPDL